MGEAAEMMLDGTLCAGCGDYLGGDQGFPVLCACCRRAERSEPRAGRFDRYAIKGNPKIANPADPLRHGGKMACPFCVRKVKVTGFGDHMLTQHRDKWTDQPEKEGTR